MSIASRPLFNNGFHVETPHFRAATFIRRSRLNGRRCRGFGTVHRSDSSNRETAPADSRRIGRFDRACGFVAIADEYQIVGFAALEIYSVKLAELRSLAVSSQYQEDTESARRQVSVKMLVSNMHKKQNVFEVMAITSSDEFFQRCGFDFTLPGEKKALFLQTRETLLSSMPRAKPSSRTNSSSRVFSADLPFRNVPFGQSSARTRPSSGEKKTRPEKTDRVVIDDAAGHSFTRSHVPEIGAQPTLVQVRHGPL